MTDAVFFVGPDSGRRHSRFWILLVLASVIAACGIVADSTAAVIGAMIVAPLMVPIQGTMLAVVLGRRADLLRCAALVLAGAAAAIAVGWVVGSMVMVDVVAETNAQVSGRVHPRLIDLLAALATGVVGSVALVRRDIADTLPGVAIAISLVPPLSVVGLTLESGATDQALGALLLFVTNVAAILGNGIVVMALYRVHRMVEPSADLGERAINRRNATAVIALMVVLVWVPLSASTNRIVIDSTREREVRPVVERWADEAGWQVIDLRTRQGEVLIRLEGPLPLPDTDELSERLESQDVRPDGVQIDLAPVRSVDLGG